MGLLPQKGPKFLTQIFGGPHLSELSEVLKRLGLQDKHDQIWKMGETNSRFEHKPLWHCRKWKSGSTSKRDHRQRYGPTGKYPLYRYETTGQLIHSKVGSNQVGCSCTLQISLSCETNTGPPKKFQHLTRAEEVVITPLRIGHTKATKSHILSRGLPTGCHYCGQTRTIDHMLLECALLQECRDEYYTIDSLNALFETIPETCIVEFLREAGFFYLIWCNLLTSYNPRTWTIWSDLSNCLENESNSETHLPV